MESEGWQNVDRVYEATLLPLISQSKHIYLAGYKPDWLNEVPANAPAESGWVVRITDTAVKVYQQYILPTDVACEPVLKDF